MTTRDWIDPPESFKRGFDWDAMSEDERGWVCERYQGTMVAAGQRFRMSSDRFVRTLANDVSRFVERGNAVLRAMGLRSD